jgi:hypothetical protein
MPAVLPDDGITGAKCCSQTERNASSTEHAALPQCRKPPQDLLERASLQSRSMKEYFCHAPYYRLPENGAHTALGDLLTVVDLMQ